MAGLSPLPRNSEPFFDPRTRNLSRPWRRFFADTRTQVIGIDTSTSPQSVDLGVIEGGLIVIKDEAGNAAANPITLLGTVQGTANPVINTNYGFVNIYGHDGLWFYWG